MLREKKLWPTKKQIVHQVDDNHTAEIKVREPEQLGPMDGKFFYKLRSCCVASQIAVLLLILTLLGIRTCTKT